MSDLTVVGPLALPAGAQATLTVRYPPGWRDAQGRLSAGTYVSWYQGGAWTAAAGGTATVPGAGQAGDPLPVVNCLLVVQLPGLPPAVQSFDRPMRDTGGGAWDFTLPPGNVTTWEGPPTSSPGAAVPGASGPTGAPGSSFRQGAGPPAAALGNLGDSYLNTLSGDVYEKRLDGWLLTGNLRGRAGNNGLDGAPGERGVPGGLRPLPTLPEQEGYVPVAQETAGGDGWAWRSPNALGLKAAMSTLTDVNLSGLSAGQTLIWNSAEGKWVPGSANAGLDAEGVQDAVAQMLTAGNGVSLNYDDDAGTLTIGTTGGSSAAPGGAVTPFAASPGEAMLTTALSGGVVQRQVRELVITVTAAGGRLGTYDTIFLPATVAASNLESLYASDPVIGTVFLDLPGGDLRAEPVAGGTNIYFPAIYFGKSGDRLVLKFLADQNMPAYTFAESSPNVRFQAYNEGRNFSFGYVAGRLGQGQITPIRNTPTGPYMLPLTNAPSGADPAELLSGYTQFVLPPAGAPYIRILHAGVWYRVTLAAE